MVPSDEGQRIGMMVKCELETLSVLPPPGSHEGTLRTCGVCM